MMQKMLRFCLVLVAIVALIGFGGAPDVHAGTVTFDDAAGVLSNNQTQIQAVAGPASFNVEVLIRDNLATDSALETIVDDHANKDGNNYVVIGIDIHSGYRYINTTDNTNLHISDIHRGLAAGRSMFNSDHWADALVAMIPVLSSAAKANTESMAATPGPVQMGTASIDDQAGFLGMGRPEIQAAANAAPFKVVVLTRYNLGSNNALKTVVRARADSAGDSVVVVGLDISLGYEFVSAADNLAIQSSDINDALNEADSLFKNKEWASGIAKVISQLTKAASPHSTTRTTSTRSPAKSAGYLIGLSLIPVLIIIGVIVLVVRSRRRKSYGPAMPTAQVYSPNYSGFTPPTESLPTPFNQPHTESYGGFTPPTESQPTAFGQPNYGNTTPEPQPMVYGQPYTPNYGNSTPTASQPASIFGEPYNPNYGSYTPIQPNQIYSPDYGSSSTPVESQPQSEKPVNKPAETPPPAAPSEFDENNSGSF